MTTPVINAPDDVTIPPEIGPGRPTNGRNQETWDSIAFWTSRGVAIHDSEEGRSNFPIERYLIPLDEVDRWCSADVTVEITEYDVWHELVDITKVVPQAYQDLTGEIGATWETWGTVGTSHVPIEIAGKWYRSNLYGAAGTRIPASAWYRFIQQPTPSTTGIFRMITVEEFQEIQSGSPSGVSNRRAFNFAKLLLKPECCP